MLNCNFSSRYICSLFNFFFFFFIFISKLLKSVLSAKEMPVSETFFKFREANFLVHYLLNVWVTRICDVTCRNIERISSHRVVNPETKNNGSTSLLPVTKDMK